MKGIYTKPEININKFSMECINTLSNITNVDNMKSEMEHGGYTVKTVDLKLVEFVF